MGHFGDNREREMASEGKKARVEMKGEGKSEGKKARVEMKGKERILFIEVNGDLLGIDLNKYDCCDLQSESVPVAAPICCRVELRKHKYPHGMRHMKVNDKLYLLGGQCFDPDLDYPECNLGCSNKVYEFNLHTQINDKEGDEPLVLHPHHVLKEVPSLLKPMSAFVANLRGRFYVLYDLLPSVIFNKPDNPDCTFEEFDPTNECWLQAPTPPLYQKVSNQDEYLDEMGWPDGMNPMSRRFVVDDKLVLFSISRDYVQVYKAGDDEWKPYPYHSISKSFNPYVPENGLWLSNLSFDDDDANLGVMLSIQLVVQRNCYGIDIPFVYIYSALDDVFHETYKVFAYAIHKSTCHVMFCQQLDEVFSGMIRTPLHGNLTNYLLDLGVSEHNNERSSRRICAILIGDDLMTRIPYLFISIFELQMTQVLSSTFLRVITPVKKLIFRLDKDTHTHPSAYIYQIPPLDAFVI